MLDLYICSFVIFQAIWTSIALETLYFLFFQPGGGGGGGGGGGSRSPVSDGVRQLLRTFRLPPIRCWRVQTIWSLYIGGKFKTSVNRNYGFN